MWQNIFIQLFSILKDFITKETNRTFVENKLTKVIDIYDTMNVLLSLQSVGRCSVFRVENSGGLIDSKTPLYYTVLHETVGDTIKPSKQELQKILLSEDDVRVLLGAIKNDHISFSVDGASNMQKTLKSKGVKSSEIFFLKASKKVIYFLSISSLEATEFNEDTVALSLAANKIKQLI